MTCHHGQAVSPMPGTRQMVGSGLAGGIGRTCFLVSDLQSLISRPPPPADDPFAFGKDNRRRTDNTKNNFHTIFNNYKQLDTHTPTRSSLDLDSRLSLSIVRRHGGYQLRARFCNGRPDAPDSGQPSNRNATRSFKPISHAASPDSSATTAGR